MPQIINPGGSFGSRLGEVLGTSFGAGLDQLANAKINQMVQRQEKTQYKGALEALGISPQESEALASLPREFSNKAVYKYLENGGYSQNSGMNQLAQQQPQQQFQQQQQQQPFQQRMAPQLNIPTQQQQVQEAQQVARQQRQPLDQQQEVINALRNDREKAQSPLNQALNKISPQLAQQIAPQLQQAQQQLPAQQQIQQPQVQAQQQLGPQRGSLAEVLGRKAPKDIKLDKTQQAYVKAYDTASETLGILDRMESLLDSGQVGGGLIKGNLPYGVLNEAEQEFADLGGALQAQLSTSGQFGNPTNAKIKFIESLKPNLMKKESVNRRNIERLRKEAHDAQGIARQRLPQGVLGEEANTQQMAQPQQQERVTQAHPVAKKQPESSKEEESWGDWFTRNLNAVHAKASGVSEEQGKEFQDWLSNLTGGKSDLPQGMREGLEAERKDNLKPRGVLEETVQDTLSSLPMLASGGPVKSIPKALARMAASSGAANITKEAGGGPVAQIAASVLANKGITATKNWLEGVKGKNIKDIAKSAAKELYEVERDLGKNINVKADTYVSDLEKLANEARKTTSIPEAEKNNFLGKVQNWFSDVKGNNRINASDIVKRKKEINSSLYSSERSHSKEYKDFMRRAQNIMFEEGDRIGQTHAKWRTAWKDADNIEKAIHYKPQFLRFLEDHPKLEKLISNPIGQIILSGGSGLGGALLGKGLALKSAGATLGVTAGVNAVKKASEIAAFALSKDPKLRSIAAKATRAVLDRNVPVARASFAKLNHLTSRYAGLLNASPEQQEEQQ